MTYLFILISMLAAVHAFTYARWLKSNGNRLGAYGIYLLIAAGLALPAYQVFVGTHR